MKKFITLLVITIFIIGCNSNNREIIKEGDAAPSLKYALEEKEIFYQENNELENVGYIKEGDIFEIYESKEIEGAKYYKISNLNEFWIDASGVGDYQDCLEINYSFELNKLKEISLLDEKGNVLENKYSFTYDKNNNLVSYTYSGSENTVFQEDYFNYAYGKDVESVYDDSKRIVEQTIKYKNDIKHKKEYLYDDLNRIVSIKTFVNNELNNEIFYEYDDNLITINNERIIEFNGNLSFIYNVYENQLTNSCIRRYSQNGIIIEEMYNPLANRFSRIVFIY